MNPEELQKLQELEALKGRLTYPLDPETVRILKEWYDRETAVSTPTVAELNNTSLRSDPTLAAYWRMTNNSNDEMGTYNGTDTSITYGLAYGKFNQGAVFGATSLIDFGNVLNVGTNSFSVSAWVKPNAPMAVASIVGKFQTAGATLGWLLKWGGAGGDSIKFHFLINDNSVAAQVNGIAVSPQDVWVHIAVSVDRTSNLMKLYQDGILRDTADISGVTGTLSNAKKLMIGNIEDTGYPATGVYMDDISIFTNKVLSADDAYTLATGIS